MKIHFISIGGSVMHQLAIALKNKGYEVTGSDDDIFEPARSNLKSAGILPSAVGWFPQKVYDGLDAVILGMHARDDNPELLKAKELKIPVYSFPEYIYKESMDKIRVVIGGSHGKTTTTSMIMHVLKDADANFDYLVGARLQGFDGSVRLTNAPILICEGDEYPASVIEKKPKFHFLFPHVAVLTGIAWDHINVFPTFEMYCEQFVLFIEKIEKDGILIYNESDPVLNDIVLRNKREDIRYKPYQLPAYNIEDARTNLTINHQTVPLRVFGQHNLLNIQAAYDVCLELGVDQDTILDSLATFQGAAKRMELIFEDAQTRVYRDFAHAPSKVKASVEAVKSQYPDRKLMAILELHTFSSLNEQFMSEYKGALDKVDEAIVFYSRHAMEIKRIPFLDPQKVIEGFNKKNLIIATDLKSLENQLERFSVMGSNFLFMSSGNYEGLDIVKTLDLK